jgi:hypothetical protein
MKRKRVSQYQALLLMFTVPPLLLALIGLGIAWFLLGPHVFSWFRSIAGKLVLALCLFAFAGLATSQRMWRLLGPVLFFNQEGTSDTDRRVVWAMFTIIPILLVCAFFPYVSAPSSRALLNTARFLIVSGLGISISFASSYIYLAVIQAKSRHCDQ